MMPDDFVFNQIFKGAIAKKASDRHAHKHAVMGLADYKKSKNKKRVSFLIEDRIKQAVADTKKGR